jgi:hypothetical protein
MISASSRKVAQPEIEKAISKLVDIDRVCALARDAAGDIANRTIGDINAKAEGIFGLATLIGDQARAIQIMLGDSP